MRGDRFSLYSLPVSFWWPSHLSLPGAAITGMNRQTLLNHCVCA